MYLPVSEMQRPVKEQSRRVVARSRATRLPPRYSAQDLEVAAVKMGCLRVRPYRKQLLFEMRRIRKALVKDGTLQRTNMKGVCTIRRGSVGGPATTRICGSADARDKKQQDSPAGSGSNRATEGDMYFYYVIEEPEEDPDVIEGDAKFEDEEEEPDNWHMYIS